MHPLEAAMRILERLGDAGKWVWMVGKGIEEDGVRAGKPPTAVLDDRLAYLRKSIAHLRKMARQGNKWRVLPVDPRTFVECKELMNKKGVLWPEVMTALEEINDGTHTECVLTGSIGVAKTTLALYTQAYQIFLLSCYRDPHKEWELDPSSEIMTIFQSIAKTLAMDVDYRRFRAMIEASPYFMARFPFNRDRESDMRFPRNILVKPVAGHDQAAIGQNVIGGILDEVNFMAVVEKSRLANDGGVYDQAVQNYNAIASRRESRFMNKGFVPGMLCLVSSRNYPGQFTDKKEQEARTNPRIYVYDKRLWQIRPDRFSGKMFRVFIGDETRRPYILRPTQQVAEVDAPLVIEVPVEYRYRFEADILMAMRDIAGVSTMALHPFIMDTIAVSSCFGVVRSIASRDDCDFAETGIEFYPERFEHLEQPRFAHVDLALSCDCCGFAVGHVPGFKPIRRGDEEELLPIIRFDLILEIRPPRGGEIELENVRKLLYRLRELGMNVKWVTFDSWQSADSLQMLRQRGFITGVQSVDEKPVPYELTKQAFYDRRVMAPEHHKALGEFNRLERDLKTRKIDHPPKGSKDCADAMAGVCFGLTMRRDVWIKHGIPLTRIPRRLLQQDEQGRGSMAAAEARAKEAVVG